jgi:uncharacterized repeat protein (TIGR03806 family)
MFNNLIQASMTSTPQDGELSVLFRPAHLPTFLLVTLIASLLTACSSSDSTDTLSGLDTLPSNTTCLASVFEGSIVSGSLKLERSYANLSLPPMTAMTMRPGDSTRWYVADRNGRIWWFDATNDNTAQLNLALDITSAVDTTGEGGLLDISFHPDFSGNGYIYVYYTATGPDSSTPLITHIVRFTTNNGGDSFDPASEFTVLTVNQPYTNHNGGKIGFGTDGYLYIGLGDGGSGGDPQNHAQNTNDLLGAMLRIDVDSGSPYAIPADNPFAGGGGRAEIYAWGLRNPWRWSFDQLTDALWLGDVGQSSWEEVDIIVNGGNYGWRCYEGSHAYNTSGCAPASNYIMPVAEYGRTEGASITGGYVYRGTAIPALTGVYVFTDFSSGTIWGLFPTGTGDYQRQTLIPTTGSGIAAMAQSNDGELYFLNLYNSQIHRLTHDTQATGGGPPVQLSATGCVDPGNPAEPAPAMIPYAVNLSFWSDGAEKERYLAVPDGTTIDIAADGDFDMPHGSVLLKHFRLNGNLIETRFMVRRDDGSWAGYSYEWNASLTDAQLVELGGKDVSIDGQTWHYPSRAECLSCHTNAAGGSLGVEALQLNRNQTYPVTGRTANQLDTFNAIGLLSEPLDPDLKNAALTTPDSPDAIKLRARSYLHANCANCHRPGGTTQANMDLRYDTAFAEMGICGVTPQNGDLGITDARLFAPGEPARSLLLERISRLDSTRMPPSSSNMVDPDGIALIADWITAVSSCN